MCSKHSGRHSLSHSHDSVHSGLLPHGSQVHTHLYIPELNYWTMRCGRRLTAIFLQDCTFDSQIVLDEPARSKHLTFESAPLEPNAIGGQIYAQPVLQVWDHSLNKTVNSQAAGSRPNRFLSSGSLLQGIIEVRSLWSLRFI
jgi:hypothetical protein